MRKPTLAMAAAALLLFSIPACGDGSRADWAALPEHLRGGVVIYGDSRTGHDIHRRLMEGMATIGPEAIFHTGDLVDDGTVEDHWITFNDITAPLPSGTAIYPALGNHEKNAQLFFDNFELPGNERWYSVDSIEGVNLVVLDTGSSLAFGSTQYAWLESELFSSVSATDYTVVTFHYPVYSTGQHGSDENGVLRHLPALFELYGVDAVFNGHDHDYERLAAGGIRYIVSGGGGAPLRDQDLSHPDIVLSEKYVKAYHFCVLVFDGARNLTVEVWNDKARMIDRFVINNR